MVERQLAAVLDEHDGETSSRDCNMETFSLELDIFGKPARLYINVAHAQARLSEMAPLESDFHQTGAGDTRKTSRERKIRPMLQRLLGLLQLFDPTFSPRGLLHD